MARHRIDRQISDDDLQMIVAKMNGA